MLKGFFRCNICCAIVGTFHAYLARMFRSFNNIVLAIAVTNNPELDRTLEGNGGLVSFWFGAFKFIRGKTGINYTKYTVIYDETAFEFIVHLSATSKNVDEVPI